MTADALTMPRRHVSTPEIPEPAVITPPAHAHPFSAEGALVEVVRGRLEGLGPTPAPALSSPMPRAR